MFAVIYVDQDCGYAKSLECVNTFSTEEEANNFIEQDKNERVLEWERKSKEVYGHDSAAPEYYQLHVVEILDKKE